MTRNLLTRGACQAIIANTEAFYCTTTTVEGYKVELYDYRLASISDFRDHSAFELRGLTFVENDNGEWERHLLLNKFFNLGETDGWLLDQVGHKRITRVQDKLDGSIISFVRFPNGVIRAKSKMSFNSTQAETSQKLYETHSHIKDFVIKMLDNNLVPVFEYVSMNNQIVVAYGEDELRLIQIRNNTTGEYIDSDLMIELAQEFGITCTADLPESHRDIDVLLDIKENSKSNDIEGFVVTFEDGQMAKVKTNHYIRQHGLIGPDAFRENLLIEAIVQESIDDVIALLVDGPKKDAILSMTSLIRHQFNHLVVEYKRLRGEYFNKYNEDRKAFALKYSNKHELFGSVMKKLNTSFRDVEETARTEVKNHILNRTKTLSGAKEYLQNIQGVQQ